MSQITLNHITAQYDGNADVVFEDCSVVFPQGWTALLGDNGIGKTTLASIATGDLTPEQGNVSNANLRAAWIQQDASCAPANIEDFGADWSSATIRMRDTLGIGDDWPYRWETLSGGERKRLQVACALALEPEVLVADEPTNHLDQPTRDAVIAALRQYRGIGIVITHDVAVINELAQRSYLLHRIHTNAGNKTAVDLFEGTWEVIHHELEQRNATATTQLKLAKAETRRLHAERQKRIEKTNQAAAASMRTPDRKDHDACKRKKFAKGGLDAGVSRNVARLEGRINQAAQATTGITTEAKRRTGAVQFDVEPSSRRELMHLEPGIIDFATAQWSAADGQVTQYAATLDGTTLNLDRSGEADTAFAAVTIPRISVGPRDRLIITGPNGAGKSTLLKALVTTLDQSIPTLVVTQHTADAHALLQQLDELNAEQRQQAIGYFVAQNGKAQALLDESALSPGECRKLQLALGLVAGPQLLILDEPTNHLDLSSKQAMVTMLQAYPCAMVLVTHDQLLLDAFTEE
ncbi:ABC transporter, ATP-binding protein [Bifidobacterium dolichotidis]|uniref:ABC transporter, ATP-binding protein n=2 Tax=Bifidobacterium dolichotidis TaxID=2306976 RepID=A0A430FTF8_9BIFI|nr:ABC transporter, ATP-binding protein [Bifidobacterium dolichotidis]